MSAGPADATADATGDATGDATDNATADGVPIVLLRHAPTRWNAEGRLQGQSDVPLSPEGRDLATRWRLPPDAQSWRVCVSPLTRCRETAAAMGLHDLVVEPRLIEASWGDWEGARLEDLRARLGAEMAANEARGLDFRPPGGESPRDLQQRLRPLLTEWADEGVPTVALCHKGVIRAIYGLATGWAFDRKPGIRFEHGYAHRFALAPDGTPRLIAADLPLAAAPSATEGAPTRNGHTPAETGGTP